ncbi:glycosyltransferase family 2 protein [uncultured Bacteroides sp.]|uniref:glycosyltransferase family 2 protein n=1 Tax=uncultured Bacteroides sp. TaxID=162156 RepID=UPI002AAA8D96|nr:glycosyltransferase family 2 protein [uncultured Bacteroides sp.]
MKTEINFSIVTPVYNREDCILRCLNSITNQNFQNVEHLIVNDGSTDGTLDILETYSKSHPHVTILNLKKNRGVNAARNFAIKQCKNSYVIFLDSDDYMSNQALNIITEKINLYPGYLHYLFTTDDMTVHYNSNLLLNCESKEIKFANWIKGEIAGDFLHVMSREMIQQFLFNENLRIYEALNFMKMYRYSNKQRFVKTIVVHLERNRHDSVTKEATLINSNAIQSQCEYLKQMIDLFEDDYKKYNISGLYSMINRCLIFNLALSDYNSYKYLSKRFKKRVIFDKIICKLKLGYLIKLLIVAYSRIKNL